MLSLKSERKFAYLILKGVYTKMTANEVSLLEMILSSDDLHAALDTALDIMESYEASRAERRDNAPARSDQEREISREAV